MVTDSVANQMVLSDPKSTRRVWKFTVTVDDSVTTHSIPSGARIVHVSIGSSPNRVAFWAEVDTLVNPVHRTFKVFGTGHPIPQGWVYVGTIPVPGYPLVWHLYEFKYQEHGPMTVEEYQRQ